MENEVVSPDELNAALAKGLENVDKGIDGAKADDTAPKPKPEEAKTETKPEAKADNGKDGETSADGKGDDETNPYRKRIDRMTRKASRLEQENADKDAALAAKDAEIARLKADKQGDEADGAGDDADAVEQKPKEDLDSKFDEWQKRKEREMALSKADQDEFDELLAENPNAKERKDAIMELSKKHPSLSYRAIDTLLAPHDYADEVEANRKNARAMGTGNRSAADLANEPNPAKMTNAQLKNQLIDDVKAGRLSI